MSREWKAWWNNYLAMTTPIYRSWGPPKGFVASSKITLQPINLKMSKKIVHLYTTSNHLKIGTRKAKSGPPNVIIEGMPWRRTYIRVLTSWSVVPRLDSLKKLSGSIKARFLPLHRKKMDRLQASFENKSTKLYPKSKIEQNY